jgi:hypothetical protein
LHLCPPEICSARIYHPGCNGTGAACIGGRPSRAKLSVTDTLLLARLRWPHVFQRRSGSEPGLSALPSLGGPVLRNGHALSSGVPFRFASRAARKSGRGRGWRLGSTSLLQTGLAAFPTDMSRQASWVASMARGDAGSIADRRDTAAIPDRPRVLAGVSFSGQISHSAAVGLANDGLLYVFRKPGGKYACSAHLWNNCACLSWLLTPANAQRGCSGLACQCRVQCGVH